MPASDFQTLLVLSTPLGIPFYSARGLKQTLTPIQAAGAYIQRDINGTLVDLDSGNASFQKYASKIECGDNDTRSALALDGVWPGETRSPPLALTCSAAWPSPSGISISQSSALRPRTMPSMRLATPMKLATKVLTGRV